jgi:hypothetical protein
VQRAPVDVNKAVQVASVYGQTYNVIITGNQGSGTYTYSFGDLLFSTVTPISLTLNGIGFPSNVQLAYQYNRCNAERTPSTDYTAITTNYQDTSGYIANVTVTICDETGAVVYTNSYLDTTDFTDTWLNAQANITYTESVSVNSIEYGAISYAYTLPAKGSAQSDPWYLPLGTISEFDIGSIIPMAAIGICFFLFTPKNAYLGGVLAAAVAAVEVYMGWININIGFIMGAFIFSVLAGITYVKRRDYAPQVS